VIVKQGDGLSLKAIEASWMESALRSDGCAVFRGYRTKPEDFDKLARRLTKTHFLGYGRAPFPHLPAITMANESPIALEPHTDNALRPEDQRPDLTWFWCVQPAKQGGETTFFDGVRVWLTLADATRALLTQKKIRFVSRYKWRDLRFPDVTAFEAFVATTGGTIQKHHDDGSAEVEVLASAVRRTRWGNELAYTSSLAIAGSKGFEAMRVTLEGDDAPFPAEVRADIDRALAACCEVLRWQIGDIVVLDNTRFLHGRRAFDDAARRMYLIQTLRANF